MQEQQTKIPSGFYKHLEKLLVVFVFCLPFYAGKILLDTYSWFQGSYINYFQLRVTLHDLLNICIVGLFILFVFRLQKFKKIEIFMYGFLLMIICNFLIVFATGHDFLFSIVSSFRLISFLLGTSSFFILLWVFVTSTPRFRNIIAVSAGISAIFQFIAALLQVLLREPIIPLIFSTLGQPKQFESFTYIGVDILSRGYGTTPHPNILGGIAVLLSMLIIASDLKKLSKTILWCTSFALVAITLSRTALLAEFVILFVFGILYFAEQKKLLSNVKKYALGVTVFLAAILHVFITALLYSLRNSEWYFAASRGTLFASYIKVYFGSVFSLLLGNGFLSSIRILVTGSSSLQSTALVANRLAFEPPHNSILLLVGELGIVPTILFILLTSLFGIHLYKKTRESPKLLWFWISLVLCAAIITALDHYLIY